MTQHNVTIKDVDYIINAFKGKQGFLLKAKLLKVISPALAALRGTAEDADMVAIITAVVSEVVSRIDESETLDLIIELLSNVYKGSVKLDFDKEFTQNYSAIYLLLAEVVKYNYKDVFQTLGITIAE